MAIFRKTPTVQNKLIRLLKGSDRVFLNRFSICVGMLFGPVVLRLSKSRMLSSISNLVVGCIKKEFSFGFLSVSFKLVFFWIILESIFDAIDLKKVLNLFAIT